MKKYIGVLFVLGLLIIPAFSFAQVGDVDPNPSSDCVVINNNLRYRDRDVNKNGEVSTLQDFLQSKGYLNSEPTGYFGLLTFKATKDFQNANNIIPVSGYVGPITRAKIKTTTCGTISTTTTPSITSIYPSSGPIGTIIELKGNNLAGFEGDLDAIIENSQGEAAWLLGIGSVPRNDQTIRVKIDSKLCKQNNSYSGLPCQSYLNIIPGIYKIYTTPWGVKSNVVNFTVISSTANNGCLPGQNYNSTTGEPCNNTMSVKVYFRKEPNVCFDQNIKVVSFNRFIPKTQAVARASIEELLKGPTQEEKNNGYWSDIPDETILKSISIVNGVALVDFNDKIESGVTTCNGGGTRISQIWQTLLQFPTIKTVKLSVNGQTDNIFQP